MAMFKSYYCPHCDKEFYDQWSDEDAPTCCGEEARNLLNRCNHFQWGGPKTFLHIRDEPFADRAELDAYAKANNMRLGEASEKVRGSRNDMYDNTGKVFSGKGMSRKQNALYSEGAQRS